MKWNAKVSTGLTLKSGAIAGALAGFLMGAVLMASTALSGLGFWTAPKAIAGFFFGIEALLGGGVAVISGLLLHFFVSAGLGAFFASWLNPNAAPGRASLVGVFYGVATWAVMTFVTLNLVDQTMRDFVAGIPVLWFLCHMIYGASLGTVPLIRDALNPVRIEPRSEEYLRRAA